MKFLVDGNLLGAEDTASPYGVSWNTTTVANGAHTLTARARDASDNTTAKSMNVTVNNAAQIPVTIGPERAQIVQKIASYLVLLWSG